MTPSTVAGILQVIVPEETSSHLSYIDHPTLYIFDAVHMDGFFLAASSCRTVEYINISVYTAGRGDL